MNHPVFNAMLYSGRTRCGKRIMDIVLHRLESGIVDCTLGERSLYSWLGAWRGWYAACTITVFGKTDLYCS
jgi:hypothetical protein